MTPNLVYSTHSRRASHERGVVKASLPIEGELRIFSADLPLPWLKLPVWLRHACSRRLTCPQVHCLLEMQVLHRAYRKWFSKVLCEPCRLLREDSESSSWCLVLEGSSRGNPCTWAALIQPNTDTIWMETWTNHCNQQAWTWSILAGT